MKTLSDLAYNKIGPRTLLKSYRIYSKGKAYANGKGLRSFLINGNTKVKLTENVSIVNKGTFRFGTLPDMYLPTNSPCSLKMMENSKLIINGYVTCGPGVGFFIDKNASLELGDNVVINANTKLACCNNIRIGNNSLISWDVQIMDSDFHKIARDSEVSGPISIGNHVLVGARAMILKSVTIGDGSVIAAGAIVTTSIPEKCLAAGVPAKIIKENIDWQA